jgi:hypothetical protein
MDQWGPGKRRADAEDAQRHGGDKDRQHGEGSVANQIVARHA